MNPKTPPKNLSLLSSLFLMFENFYMCFPIYFKTVNFLLLKSIENLCYFNCCPSSYHYIEQLSTLNYLFDKFFM
jgi:hypothetical protein